MKTVSPRFLWIVFSYFPQQLFSCDIYSSAMLWWSRSFLCIGAPPSGLWRRDFCLTVSLKGIRDIKSPPLTCRESKGSWRLYHCASELSCFLPMECLSSSTPLIKKLGLWHDLAKEMWAEETHISVNRDFKSHCMLCRSPTSLCHDTSNVPDKGCSIHQGPSSEHSWPNSYSAWAATMNTRDCVA